MEESVRKTVVVSAVNIRKGGTLTILRSCLKYLSDNEAQKHRIVALVHDRALCDYPGIEYIELPGTIKSWSRRLWCEYVTMHRISRQIAAQDGHKVWMWLSLHDTTPRVEAEHREVYCHTSFPFMKVKARDFLMDPKIPLFALLTKWVYRINVTRNDCLIVQQEWFRRGLSRITGFPEDKIRVIPPQMGPAPVSMKMPHADVPFFFYASTPDCHKNFETLCEAARLLERRIGPGNFKLVLTIDGTENRYSRWLYKEWGGVESIDFHGFMTKEELYGHYKAATAFVFPSRVETWGLPISEFISTGSGRLILADLPYAHESSLGAKQEVVFFPALDADNLSNKLYESLTVR